MASLFHFIFSTNTYVFFIYENTGCNTLSILLHFYAILTFRVIG